MFYTRVGYANLTLVLKVCFISNVNQYCSVNLQMLVEELLIAQIRKLLLYKFAYFLEVWISKQHTVDYLLKGLRQFFL